MQVSNPRERRGYAAKSLTELLRSRKWTPSQIARRMEVSEATVWRWFQGRPPINSAILEQLRTLTETPESPVHEKQTAPGPVEYRHRGVA